MEDNKMITGQQTSKIDSQMLQELENQQFVPHAPVWTFNKELVTLESGEYDVKAYTTKDGSRSFSKAFFEIDGKEYAVQYRYKEVANDQRTIMIARHVAVVKDPGGIFKTPSGTIIKDGEVKYFAINV